MKINNKSISIAFVIILAATVIISLAGILLMSRQPLVLQGQVEATEIRISGKLPQAVLTQLSGRFYPHQTSKRP